MKLEKYIKKRKKNERKRSEMKNRGEVSLNKFNIEG
jgi:hypothetical protein